MQSTDSGFAGNSPAHARAWSAQARYIKTHGRFAHLSRCVCRGFPMGSPGMMKCRS